MLKQTLFIGTFLVSSFAAYAQQAPALPSVDNGANTQIAPAATQPPVLPVIPPRVQPRAASNSAEQAEPPSVEATLPNSGKQPIGVPFPNAIKGADKQQGKMPVPLSTQSMSLDPNHVDNSIKRAEDQADTRLNALRPGSGDLPAVDTSAIRPELEQMSRIQREIRLFELKQREADLAIKYWTTVYDGPREDAAAKAAASAMSNVGVKAAEAIKDTNKDNKDDKEAAAKAAQPLPKVVSILGTAGRFHATLLVPYVGEVTARPGTLLPGNRRVTSITPNGVVVNDGGNSVTLGFGDSVPLAPFSASTQQESSRRPEIRR